MKRLSKHKLGFSLVEMVLVLAIICLLGGIVGGLCLAISNSFITTYNIDDSSDYAILFARGFENSFLARQQSTATNGLTTWFVDTSTSYATYPTLRVKEGSGAPTAVFEPQFLGGSDGTYKWKIYMFYKWEEASERVLYAIILKDNKTGTDFTYFYQGAFWVPRYLDRKEYTGSSKNIMVSGNQLTSTFLTDTVGIAANKIPSNVQGTGYYTQISFSG